MFFISCEVLIAGISGILARCMAVECNACAGLPAYNMVPLVFEAGNGMQLALSALYPHSQKLHPSGSIISNLSNYYRAQNTTLSIRSNNLYNIY